MLQLIMWLIFSPNAWLWVCFCLFNNSSIYKLILSKVHFKHSIVNYFLFMLCQWSYFQTKPQQNLILRISDTVTAIHNESVLLNESVKSFNDSFIKTAVCFAHKWINIVEWNGWVNDSVTHSKTAICLVHKWISDVEQISWVNDSMTH